jgi:hypothetical protein
MIVVPTIVLTYTSYKVAKLVNRSASATGGSLNDERSKARAKRNQSITRMLIGIIVMFLICHTGKVSYFFFIRESKLKLTISFGMFLAGIKYT